MGDVDDWNNKDEIILWRMVLLILHEFCHHKRTKYSFDGNYMEKSGEIY